METVQTVRIDHGSVPASAMAYSQRQPTNHRPSQPELYKPSRSPIPSATQSRYPYPGGGSAQGPGGPPGAPPPSARYMPTPPSYQTYREYRPRLQLLHPGPARTPPGPYGDKEYIGSNKLFSTNASRTPPFGEYNRVGRITILSPGSPRDSPYGERDYRPHRISLLQADPTRTSPYGDEYRQPRISLLHPEYAIRPRMEQAQSTASQLPPPPTNASQPPPPAQPPSHQTGQNSNVLDGTQPFKKIRLQEHKEQMPPLRIDTRDQPGSYNPQVEAISPTLPDNHLEDQAFKRKDELLQDISKVDREIAKTEQKIAILKKKQAELEELASKPASKLEVEEVSQPKHQSLAQKIYADNRKKAQAAHSLLDSLGPKVEWPIYNQPSDTSVYHENKRKHQTFKRRLLEYFKKRHQDKEARENYLTQTYSKLMQEWLRKVDKIESSQKRKAKEAKNREFFEKVFPELRKQREDKERFNRVGARIKSEADLEEIMDGLQEQEMEDKKMRSYAVIPPILLDARQRKLKYVNNNGHILDMELEHKERQNLNVWTSAENEIFKEKYLQHPKNFGVIASYLDRKSVQDCVQHYYLTKKTENYKQLLRKSSRQRTRASRNNPQKVNNAGNNPIVDGLSTGVTTRLQREQQQKTVQVIEQQRQQQQTQQSQQQTQQQPQQQSTQQQQEMSVTTASTTVTTTTTTTNTTVPVTSSSTTNPTTNSTTNPTNSSTTTSSTTTTVTSTNTTIVTTSTSNTTSSGTNSNNNNTTSNTNSNNNVINSANKSSGGAADEKAKVVTINSSNIIVSTSTAASGVTAVSSPSVVTSASEQNAATPPQQQQTQTQPPQVTNCDQQEPMIVDNTSNSDPNNTNAENKKKKERRKDKDNASMETSDDENPEGQDKTIHQGQCVVCKAQLGPQLQSRPLAASQASQYGLREEDITSGSRVCNTCRCKCVRSRYTHCPLPTCPNARGRVKRLRSLPQRWQEISSDMKDPIIAEFQIPQGVTKCCSACFNRISRRLGAQEDWPEEEVNRLKMYLLEIGAVWTAIGEGLGRPGHQVKAFYSANRKRYNLEACLGDRKPQLTDEEDSGSSTSSCEEPMRERHSSDTASAESPPAQPEQPQGGPQRKEDYDSSATETADEGQTPDHYQGSATITAVNSDGQRPSNSPPMTVKELMSNVIELQLMKNPSGMCQLHPPVSGVTPTISSILNIDSPDVTITREYNLNTQQPPTSRPDLATLVTPLIAATITPVPPAGQQEPTPSPREQEQLVVLPVEGREPEPLTLDLSLKKPRGECPPPAHKHNPIHRTPESNYIQYHHERKSPAVYVPTVSRAPSKLPSPKMANPKAGSITLGTPIINQQQRYSEGLLRQMTPEPKMGSITQGTPIHMPPHVQDKRMYDYYNKRNQPPQNVANYPGTYRQPFNFSVEQRQIIMNDYITSQQMLGTRRGEKPTGQPPQNYYPARSPRRTPPLPQPQRQGVIQRHTRPQPGHYPPGHEALSSLVDVAVQQPSLPVPATPHEGLGKTIADHLSEPHRFQLAQMQQQQMRQQRLQEEHRVQMAYREQAQQQAARQSRNQSSQSSRSCDSSTVTAASLIDAIITHQINQGNEGGGREVVQNNREPPRPGDRLFQSFARDQPEPPPPQNNGEQRSPSVISVDLDAEPTQNKSMTVKDITDSVISMDFNQRPNVYYHQDNVAEWKRRIQKEDANKQRSTTPQTDERQIIRIAQPQQQQQKYQPVSPPGNNHWPEQDFHRYQTQSHPQSHISALDYVKHRIVKAMLSEDDTKRDNDKEPHGDKAPDSPGEMVIDEDKYEVKYQTQNQNFAFPYSALNVSHVNSQTSNKINSEQQITNNDNNIQNPNEPKPLLSANYEPLSDED